MANVHVTYVNRERVAFDAHMNAQAAAGLRVQNAGMDKNGNWWAIYRTVVTQNTTTYTYQTVSETDRTTFEAVLNTLDAAYWRMVNAGRDDLGNWWAVMINYPTGPYSATAQG